MSRPPYTMVILPSLCLCVAVISLMVGSSGLSWDAVALVIGGDPIIAGLRGPRIVLAALVGASLAMAGVAMQTLMRNELADPYLLGISGGASVGAVVSLALWPWLPPGPAAAVGAGLAAAFVRSVVRSPYEPSHLLLAGVTIASLLGGITGLILILAPQASTLRSAMFWLFGGFGTPPWSLLSIPALTLVLSGLWLLSKSHRLDRLLLGDDVAATLGVPLQTTRRGVLVVALALTAASVAVAGLVGFVGLLGPHIARRLVGHCHKQLILAAACVGAAMVMSADAFARTAFAPREVPVGLITALIGGPLFLLLLPRRAAL